MYFESKGYAYHAPAHPHKEGSPAVLRQGHPYSPIAHNSLASVTESYAAFIRLLPERPILIVHSFGGLMVQLLLQQQLAVAGVAIHSVPPQETTARITVPKVALHSFKQMRNQLLSAARFVFARRC
ncbi:hypothetical protein [Hymenobacter fodinae]|uniref:Alpha/beta hydrolase n=1 Tax=Hymenobacter fodinae TaxID=2510796 RepID=A0A4Z0NZB5_9BACT|nr:hypothetical protein [Hymenobacter fodinae]TGE03759.1 hypothetical protein EU556_24415 [Hymenobacter fodinae]